MPNHHYVVEQMTIESYGNFAVVEAFAGNCFLMEHLVLENLLDPMDLVAAAVELIDYKVLLSLQHYCSLTATK